VSAGEILYLMRCTFFAEEYFSANPGSLTRSLAPNAVTTEIDNGSRSCHLVSPSWLLLHSVWPGPLCTSLARVLAFVGRSGGLWSLEYDKSGSLNSTDSNCIGAISFENFVLYRTLVPCSFVSKIAWWAGMLRNDLWIEYMNIIWTM